MATSSTTGKKMVWRADKTSFQRDLPRASTSIVDNVVGQAATIWDYMMAYPNPNPRTKRLSARVARIYEVCPCFLQRSCTTSSVSFRFAPVMICNMHDVHHASSIGCELRAHCLETRASRNRLSNIRQAPSRCREDCTTLPRTGL